MSVQTKEAVVERYFEEFLHKKSIDAVGELIAENFYIIDPVAPTPKLDQEEFKQFVVQLRTMFPDLNFKILKTEPKGSKVVAYWKADGSHTGQFAGVKPKGQRLYVSGSHTFSIDNTGKVQNVRVRINPFGIIRAVGIEGNLKLILFNLSRLKRGVQKWLSKRNR